MTCRSSFTFAASLCTLLCAPLLAADVNVPVNAGQLPFYGRIDIGSVSPPRLIYQQPVLIESAPLAVMQRPIYMRVPPGHAKNWSKHCGRYNACRQQTYFVQEDWYQTVYAPAHGSGRSNDRERGDPRYGQLEHRQPHDQDHRNQKHGDEKHGDEKHGNQKHGGRGNGKH